MTKQVINVGTTANDKKGDSLRAAFQKVNANFTELYTALGLDSGGLNLGAFEFTGSIMSTTDSTPIVIDQATTITSDLTVSGDVLPSTANGGDLGSSARPWRSLYVSNNTIFIGGNALSIDSNGDLTLNNNRIVQENGEFLVLDNLTDVSANSPSVGDVLAWNGGSWVNADQATVPTLTSQLTNDSGFITAASIPTDFKGSVFADDSTLMIDAVDNKIYATGLTVAVGNFVNVNSNNVDVENINGLASQINFTVGGYNNLVIENNLVTIQNVSLSVAGDITLGGAIRSEGAINIDINLTDSTLRRWTFSEDGDLTLPNNQKIDATSATVLSVGSSNASVYLDSTNRVAKIIAKKHFNRSFGQDGVTLTYTSATVTAAFATNQGLYFKQLLSRLTDYFVGNTEFVYDYSNVTLTINPDGENLASTVTNVVSDGSDPPTYTITLATAHEEPIIINYIVFDYDYNNTIGLDVDNDFFGIATDNDDLDLRSGRDIDLMAADDIRVQAGSFMSIELVKNDNQGNTDGIEITTTSAAGYKNWKFQFDGDLAFPDATVQTTAFTGTANIARNIESENDVSIKVNLTDSTQRIWSFGEDGELRIPGNIVHRSSPGLTIGSSYNVYIVGDQGDNNRTWTFDGTSGDTELPNGTVIADDGDDGIEIVMPTTNGLPNSFKWKFSDVISGVNDTITLEYNLLGTNLSEWYFAVNNNATAKYLYLDGATQSLTMLTGALTNNGKLIFGTAAGNNAGDANAIELKATDGDVYLTSTESVKITVDANDSSARVWTFDPTGELTVPGNISRVDGGDLTISAAANIYIDSTNNSSLWIGTASNTDSVILGSKTNGNDVAVLGDLQIITGVYETFSSIADATGVVTHNCSNGHIFYHTSPDANWTVNITNLNSTQNRATTITCIISQGGTGYYPNALQIAGAAQTINWQGNTTPTPSTNRTDVVTFSILNTSGGYTVLGQLTGF